LQTRYLQPRFKIGSRLVDVLVVLTQDSEVPTGGLSTGGRTMILALTVLLSLTLAFVFAVNVVFDLARGDSVAPPAFGLLACIAAPMGIARLTAPKGTDKGAETGGLAVAMTLGVGGVVALVCIPLLLLTVIVFGYFI